MKKEKEKREFKREFSAGGIVYREKDEDIEYLLIKDGYGRWGLPKGHYEEGEKGKETALREVREETGLSSLKIVDKLPNIKYFFKEKNKLIFKIVNFFLIQAAKDDHLKPASSEIQDAQWFLKEEVFQKIDYKNVVPVFKKAIEKVERINGES